VPREHHPLARRVAIVRSCAAIELKTHREVEQNERIFLLFSNSGLMRREISRYWIYEKQETFKAQYFKASDFIYAI